MKTVGQLKRLRKTINLQRIMLIAVSVLCIGLFIRANTLTKQNLHLIEEKEYAYEQLELQIQDNIQLQTVAQELDAQLQQVSEVNKSYVDELNELRVRSELYDKYSYAIMGWDGRTELTYEEIKLGEQLMLEQGFNPHLMFGTIMVESTAIPDLVNPKSGATGYGQFLDGTARWVYTSLMGLSDYYSDIRKDGETNIRMMAKYYGYLYDLEGTTFRVIKHYSGNKTDYGAQQYLDRINRFTNMVGVTIQ